MLFRLKIQQTATASPYRNRFVAKFPAATAVFVSHGFTGESQPNKPTENVHHSRRTP
jgi:hypothetical protein